jgi:hypothetical protein
LCERTKDIRSIGVRTGRSRYIDSNKIKIALMVRAAQHGYLPNNPKLFHRGLPSNDNVALISKLDLKNTRRKLLPPLGEDSGIIQLSTTSKDMKVTNKRETTRCLWNLRNFGEVGSVPFPLLWVSKCRNSHEIN